MFHPPALLTVRQTSPSPPSLGLKKTPEIIERGAFESLGHLKDLSLPGKISAPPLKHLPRSTISSKVPLLFVDCGELMAPALLEGAGTFCGLCRENSDLQVVVFTTVEWPEHLHHLRGLMRAPQPTGPTLETSRVAAFMNPTKLLKFTALIRSRHCEHFTRLTVNETKSVLTRKLNKQTNLMLQ